MHDELNDGYGLSYGEHMDGGGLFGRFPEIIVEIKAKLCAIFCSLSECELMTLPPSTAEPFEHFEAFILVCIEEVTAGRPETKVLMLATCWPHAGFTFLIICANSLSQSFLSHRLHNTHRNASIGNRDRRWLVIHCQSICDGSCEADSRTDQAEGEIENA